MLSYFDLFEYYSVDFLTNLLERLYTLKMEILTNLILEQLLLVNILTEDYKI